MDLDQLKALQILRDKASRLRLRDTEYFSRLLKINRSVVMPVSQMHPNGVSQTAFKVFSTMNLDARLDQLARRHGVSKQQEEVKHLEFTMASL